MQNVVLNIIVTLISSSQLNVKCKGTWGQKNVFENETHSRKWGRMQEIKPNDSKVHSHFGNYISATILNI
jgi:hypothetical protein